MCPRLRRSFTLTPVHAKAALCRWSYSIVIDRKTRRALNDFLATTVRSVTWSTPMTLPSWEKLESMESVLDRIACEAMATGLEINNSRTKFFMTSSDRLHGTWDSTTQQSSQARDEVGLYESCAKRVFIHIHKTSRSHCGISLYTQSLYMRKVAANGKRFKTGGRFRPQEYRSDVAWPRFKHPASKPIN